MGRLVTCWYAEALMQSVRIHSKVYPIKLGLSVFCARLSKSVPLLVSGALAVFGESR